MKGKNISRVFFSFIFTLSLMLALSGQTGRARINGTIKDDTGNPLEGAKIVAFSAESNSSVEAISDNKGLWAIAGLGTATYKITASKEGFGTVSANMNVSQVNPNSPLHITLNRAKPAAGIPFIQDEASRKIFDEGNQFYEEKKYPEAIAKFEEFLEKNPSIYQVNINLGNCYREVGEFDKAVAAYNKILDKVKSEKGTLEGNESAARALANMGEAYIKQGNMEKAFEYLKQAIDMSPKDESLAFNVGEVLFKQAETDRAIEYFNRAVEINPKWAPPYRELGYAYLNKGDYKLAVERMKKFLEVAPSDDPQVPIVTNLIPTIEKLIKD